MKKSRNIISGGLNVLKTIWRHRESHASYLRWIISYSKPYMPRILLVIFMNLAVSLTTAGMAVITKNIVDTATEGRGGFAWMVALYAGCILFNLCIGAGSTAMVVVISEKFSFGIRKQIYEKIIKSYWMDSQKFHTGDLMTRLTSDAGNISDGIVGVVPEIIRLFLELIVMFFTLLYFSPLLAVFALAMAPVGALISIFFGRILKKLQVKVQESESSYRSFLQESLTNLLIIKSFANEDYAADRLTELRDQRFFWVFKRSRFSIATSSSLSLTFQIGYIAAFAYGALQISQKMITYGTMSIFITLVVRVQAPVYAIAQSLPKLAAVIASAGRVMELQDIPPETVVEKDIGAGQVGIDISDLSFGYVDEPVFENASVNICPGEFVAVIGESGIGKTTLIRMIMSFINVSQGNLTFYNNSGETEKAGAGARRFISYVPQGNTLFSGTIRENIRMGKLDATEEEMLDALRLSSGYDFVMGLPDGLDTLIGERGHGLSEGQAQRISIARAVIKKAPLLILDEATSALDEKTELSVLEGLKRLQPVPTCLLITHRRSVLDYCDRGIKIEDKKITVI